MLERREAVGIRNQEMCDMAISIINKYVDEHLCVTDYLGRVNPKESKEYFEDLSYARWAAYEIMDRLNNEAERLPSHITGSLREPVPPVDIIAGFMDDMECCIYDGCSEKHERIFTIAKDVADDIILLFL
ncbi:MAG: hypothetical protein PHU69_02955 [Fermentimonas sp.]|nr:hypothetical protein [Fermentimonas sp.]